MLKAVINWPDNNPVITLVRQRHGRPARQSDGGIRCRGKLKTREYNMTNSYTNLTDRDIEFLKALQDICADPFLTKCDGEWRPMRNLWKENDRAYRLSRLVKKGMVEFRITRNHRDYIPFKIYRLAEAGREALKRERNQT